MKRLLLLLALSISIILNAQLKSIEPISFSEVTITDNFWKPRIEQVATTTLEACIYQTEVKTARIRNFEIVTGTRQGKFEGIFYDDSDVFKALEAIAYSLKNKPNPTLEKKRMNGLIKLLLHNKRTDTSTPTIRSMVSTSAGPI